MKNSIGKPCEGKLHARFDVGGTDSLFKIITFMVNILSGLSGSTLRVPRCCGFPVGENPA